LGSLPFCERLDRAKTFCSQFEDDSEDFPATTAVGFRRSVARTELSASGKNSWFPTSAAKCAFRNGAPAIRLSESGSYASCLPRDPDFGRDLYSRASKHLKRLGLAERTNSSAESTELSTTPLGYLAAR
jgi:hypothetical protein